MRISLAIPCMIVVGLLMIGCARADKPAKNDNAAGTKGGPSATNAGAPATEDTAERIELADAKAAFDDGSAVFIDTRQAEYYDAEHIKGAISIPVAELDKKFDKIPKGKKIIAYCS